MRFRDIKWLLMQKINIHACKKSVFYSGTSHSQFKVILLQPMVFYKTIKKKKL